MERWITAADGRPATSRWRAALAAAGRQEQEPGRVFPGPCPHLTPFRAQQSHPYFCPFPLLEKKEILMCLNGGRTIPYIFFYHDPKTGVCYQNFGKLIPL